MFRSSLSTRKDRAREAHRKHKGREKTAHTSADIPEKIRVWSAQVSHTFSEEELGSLWLRVLVAHRVQGP